MHKTMFSGSVGKSKAEDNKALPEWKCDWAVTLGKAVREEGISKKVAFVKKEGTIRVSVERVSSSGEDPSQGEHPG